MLPAIKNTWFNFLRLFQLLAFYGAGISALFYVLPIAAEHFHAQYEVLSGTARTVAVAGLLLVIAIWQVLGKRDRLRGGVA